MERIQDRRGLTLLIDGWEDIAKRSLYGAVLTERGKHPVVLGLTDLTGKRASADVLVGVCDNSLQKLCFSASQLGALCSDNPSVMKKLRRLWETKYSHIIVCALLLINIKQLTSIIYRLHIKRKSKNVNNL